MGLPCGEETMMVGRTMWTQSTSVTDGQTDRQPWTAPSRSTDRMSVSLSVRETVSVEPDSGVANLRAAVTRPDAEIAGGLVLPLVDCTFLLENRDSCVFELLDCFLAL